MINAAKQTSEELCRNRWNQGEKNGVICIDEKYPGTLGVSLSIDSSYENKTLIVSGLDVVIPSNYLLSKTHKNPLDIFINKGNLVLVQDGSNTGNLMSFDVQGNPTTTAGVSSGEFLKGTFIVNGLVWGRGYDGVQIPNKVFIHGKITSLNSVENSVPRVTQVSNLLGKPLSVNEVSLPLIFVWQCK